MEQIEPKYLRIVSDKTLEKVAHFLGEQGWESNLKELSIDQMDYLKDVILATYKIIQE